MAAWHMNISRIAALAVMASFLASLAGCRDDVRRVRIAGETFTMELALTDEQITRGMGGRDSFPEGGGMMFVFAEADHRGFWMKDCLIDIDLIFIDSRGIVTAVHRMPAEPPRQEGETQREYENRLPLYHSYYPAQFAIELPAGSIDRLGVKPEDRIQMDLEGLKALVQ
jgi:uncharacterized membrane protein (UPF0127 family)